MDKQDSQIIARLPKGTFVVICKSTDKFLHFLLNMPTKIRRFSIISINDTNKNQNGKTDKQDVKKRKSLQSN